MGLYDTICSRAKEFSCDRSLVHSDLITTEGRVEKVLFSPLHSVVRSCCELITMAQSEVLLVTSYWEASSQSALLLTAALESVKNVRIRLVLDNADLRNFCTSRVRVPKKEHFRYGTSFPWFDNLEITSYHVPLMGTMHGKFLVVDRKICAISSNNVQDRPNLEMFVSMSGPVVTSFVNTFETIWTGKRGMYVGNDISPNVDNVPMCLVSRKAHGGIFRDVHSPQNVAWTTAIEGAERSVLLVSPTFNAAGAIRAVYRACRRGTEVTLYLTLGFNDRKESMPFQGGTNLEVVRKLYRRLRRKGCAHRLHVHWYVAKGAPRPKRGVHSHVKLLIVDDELSIFGNGNMDTQSWYYSLEINVMLYSESFAATCKRLLLKTQDTHLYSWPQKTLDPGPPIAL